MAAWRRCQFSYFIAYWAKSAELYLQQSLVKEGSLAAPVGLLTSKGKGDEENELIRLFLNVTWGNMISLKQ